MRLTVGGIAFRLASCAAILAYFVYALTQYTDYLGALSAS